FYDPILFFSFIFFFSFLVVLRPPSSTLFPYTTLFRSFSRASRMRAWLVGQMLASAVGADRQAARSTADRRGRLTRVKIASEDLGDRKSTRLNSSHVKISYAVFCLKKKKKAKERMTPRE